jgi:hypothetical protein
VAERREEYKDEAVDEAEESEVISSKPTISFYFILFYLFIFSLKRLMISFLVKWAKGG